MKICPVCQAQLEDNLVACPCCGTTFEANPQPQAQPAVGQPVTGQPAVGQPAVGQPAVGQSSVGQSSVGQPAAAQPAAGQPAVGQQTPPPQPGQYAPPYAPYPSYAAYQPYVDPSDHTAEFEAEDIAKNKLFAMACYLLSVIGVVIAALCAKESPFVQFHIRQAMKLAICEVLLALICVVLFFTVIVPLAAGVCLLVLEVVSLVCFFQTAGNKAKEAPIVKSFGFLK